MLSIFLRNLLLMLLFFSAISACKKDDNPAGSGTGGGGGNSFTINGSGWNNVTYTVPSGEPGAPFNRFALGFYNTSDSSTIVVNISLSGSDSTTVAFGFQSRQVGNFQGNSPVARAIQVVSRGRNFIGGFETNTTLIPNTTFNLNVTRYEDVNGKIQGSYTGTLRELVGLGFGNETITITGNFNVQRLPDDFDGGGDVLQRRLFTHEK